ncbi:MAG: carbohydrate ABC transporter permease [Spirochaetales bacterium]|nr:carbohydrate ABC transporter permease [Spirochaetales bacterium]
MTIKQNIFKIILTVILFTIGISMVLPVLWMVSSSLKYEAEVFKMPMEWIPREITSQNYQKAVTDFPYFKWYGNTFKTTFWIVVISLIFNSLSGYAFAKLRFHGREFIFALFIATLMIPMQVRIIPQFLIFKAFGMINTHYAVVLPWIYNGFAIFLMRQFFMTIPDEMIEAAKIDGSGEFRTFWQIVMPLARPALIALTILSFTWGWNQYFGPLIYLSETTKQVLAVGITNFKSQYSSNFALQMAGSTLALIPILAVYLIAQKHFIEGIAMSGIKG